MQVQPSSFTAPKTAWAVLAWDVAAATLVLLLPMLVFLRHNDYPLLRPETLSTLLLVALAGLFWGLLMWFGRRSGRIVVTTFLLVLVVDVQTKWITTAGLRLLLTVLAMGALAWLIRRYSSQILVVLFGAMVLGTLFQPADRMVRHRGEFPGPGTGNLPFVLHLILDEYAAPEALDHRYDPNGATAAEAQAFFVDWGFTLFSRAYSRYYDTNESIPNTLNRGLREEPEGYWPDGFHEGGVLTQNDWFTRLDSLGYDLHTVQTDFIDYAAPELGIRSSSSYDLETVHSVASADLRLGEKLAFILGTYSRLSWFLGMFRQGYDDLSTGSFGRVLHLPESGFAENRFSSLTAMGALGDLALKLKRARPGQALIAHLMFPHYPYAYRADCSLKPRSRMWLNGSDRRLEPARNDSISRAKRYPMYLEQIQCTNRQLDDLFSALVQAGVWDDAIVVLHGDHGSRLNMAQPMPSSADQMVASDYMDAFGTLLAVKLPGVESCLNRRQVPLQDVFEGVFLDAQAVWPPVAYKPDLQSSSEPWVLLNDRESFMERRTLPPFASGVPDSMLVTTDAEGS